jgi:2-dehydropantoate 2-reductase
MLTPSFVVAYWICGSTMRHILRRHDKIVTQRHHKMVTPAVCAAILRPMRYVIYGAGGIGGVIGARLIQQGHEAVLIARGRHLEALQEAGLTLRTPSEDVTLPVTAVGHPSEITFTPDDVVMLTMKTQDTSAALDELRAVAGDVPVICAQNGVTNERMALRRFSRVYGMLVVLPAVHLEPGIVLTHTTGVGGVLDAGRYPTGTDALIERVTADLQAAGFAAQPDANIMRIKYTKLLQNSGNSIQALCGPDAAAGDLARLVREEVVAAYEAAGIDFAPLTELRERYDGMVLGAVGGETRWGGSTWQSLQRGAGSIETDYLNGEIALLGALHGVPTPYNRLLQSLAADAVRTGVGPAAYTPQQVIEMGQAVPAAG